VNLWLVATMGFLLALVPAALVIFRGGRFDRLVALELATTVTVLALISLACALERPSYLDVALTLALLAFPGTLAFAITLERWL
jgi:multisubunit Na+/H+ antiporter MnhF subunit